MQRETSNDSFLDYGSVYHQPIDREHPELIHQTMVAITRRYVSQFYCFNCDTYLQVKSGIGVLLVSHTAEASDVQEFAMNRLIHIRPNIYFAVVSTTQKLEYDLCPDRRCGCNRTRPRSSVPDQIGGKRQTSRRAAACQAVFSIIFMSFCRNE